LERRSQEGQVSDQDQYSSAHFVPVLLADILSEKQLLEVIAGLIQQRRPELIPGTSQQKENTDVVLSDPHASSSSKPPRAPSKHQKRKIRTPAPPKPYPPLPQRISAFSPTLVSGVLIDAVKAGMDAMKQQQADAQGAAAGVGKGKRKVVRVRG
jgi:signal recognition particle subunit SRP19